jgi:hypothetical protein
MGFSQGASFEINGCKVADGGREDSNGLLIGFSLLGVSDAVFLWLSCRLAKHQLVTRHNTTYGCGVSLGAFTILSLVALLRLHSSIYRLESCARYLRVCLEFGELG